MCLNLTQESNINKFIKTKVMQVQSPSKSQNIKQSVSQHSNNQPSKQPHSQQDANPIRQEWVATYLQGQYYLTDRQSLDRLKAIERQIELEKNKLAMMDDTQQDRHSFYSLQEEIDRVSNISYAGTEFSPQKETKQQDKAQNELQDEEEKYRQKIKNQSIQKSNLAEPKISGAEQLKSKANVSALNNNLVSSKKQSVSKVDKTPSCRPSGNKSINKSRLQEKIHQQGLLMNKQQPSDKQYEVKVNLIPSQASQSNLKQDEKEQSIILQAQNNIVPKSTKKQSHKASIPEQVQLPVTQHQNQPQPASINDRSVKSSQRHHADTNEKKSSKSKVNRSLKKELLQKSIHSSRMVDQPSAHSDHLELPNNKIENQSSKSKPRSSLKKDLLEKSIKSSKLVEEELHSAKASNHNNLSPQIANKSHKSRSNHSHSQAENPNTEIYGQKSSHNAIDQPKTKSVRSQISNRSNNKDQQKQSTVRKDNQKLDKSIQYSRVSESSSPQHINEIKFQHSEQSNSLIQHKQSSVNQSSHVEMFNNQLESEKQIKIEAPNMKKKKQSAQNVSDKKTKSFIIHSRNGSLKEKSQYGDKSSSKFSLEKSEKKSYISHSRKQSEQNQETAANQIRKLYEQIQNLKEKLHQVEERQIQIQKQSSLSKANNDSLIQQSEKPKNETTQFVKQALANLKNHPHLQLESSIIQINTREQQEKLIQQQQEVDEKKKLTQQIYRLKSIIRDLQIEKIKSIDHEQNNNVKVSKFIERQISNHQSRVSNQQLHLQSTQMSPTKRLRSDDFGKIIRNFPQQISTPKSKIKVNSPTKEQVNLLPYQSINKKVMRSMRQTKPIQKIQEKDKEFHNFIESSRVLGQDVQSRQEYSKEMKVQNLNFSPFPNISKIESKLPNETKQKINYSRLVEELKNSNPEDDEVIPQINIRDIIVPTLSRTPSAQMNQQQLLNLAKQTYSLFGVNIENEEKQLCVKKYKNCVFFSVHTSQCILWHFSGKFYMGGWKSSQNGQGEKHGEGLEIVQDKHIYQGQFLNGKRNGTGILKTANGNIYDGQWVQGNKNGHGVYFDSATSTLYSGQWKDNKKDGQGLLKLSEKQYYFGTFSKSIKEGYGIQMFVNGDKYKGEYKGGKFHGKGKYAWANGSSYQGQFYEGTRHGQGSWKSAKQNGDIYIGSYEKDKKNGYGRYVWSNGCTYDGFFMNDCKHGKGRLTYQDGREVKGNWEEGNLTSTENQKKIGEHEDLPLRKSVKISSIGFQQRKNYP